MDRSQRICLIVGIVASIALVVELSYDQARVLRSYLYAYIFLSGLTLGFLWDLPDA